MKELKGDAREEFLQAGWGEIIFADHTIKAFEATIAEVAAAKIGLFGGDKGNKAFDGIAAKFGDRTIRFWREMLTDTVIELFHIQCTAREVDDICIGLRKFGGTVNGFGISGMEGYWTFETE